jgi:hypothetical protein
LDSLVRGLGVNIGNDPNSWVKTEQERVVGFWSDSDSTRIVDAAITRILDQIERLRSDVRRAG